MAKLGNLSKRLLHNLEEARKLAGPRPACLAHVLCSMLNEQSGVGYDLLASKFSDKNRIRELARQLRELADAQNKATNSNVSFFSLRLASALAEAETYADKISSNLVRTDHLVAVISSSESTAGRILRSFGIANINLKGNQ